MTAYNLDLITLNVDPFFVFPDVSLNIEFNSPHDDGDKENESKDQSSINLEMAQPEKDEDFVELDEETLEILGEGPFSNEMEFTFHPKLAETWKKVLVEDIDKEGKIKFFKMYPRKGNCPIDTPKLNPEVEAILNDTVKKRDKYLAIDQDLCGASLSSLGKAVNMILNDKKDEIDRKELLTALTDSGRIMCELFKQLTKARKMFIYPGLDKKAKALLEKVETDEFLFGSTLSQRVKTAKSVEKVGLSLKTKVAEKKPPFRSHSGLNWRGPSAKSSNQFQAGHNRKGYNAPRRAYHQSKAHEKHREKTPIQQSTGQSNAGTTSK